MVSHESDLAACERLLSEARERGLAPRRLCLEAMAAAALWAGSHARAAELLQEARASCAMPPTRKTRQLEEQARAAGSAEGGAPAGAPGAPSGALPDGWQSALCPNSGLTYYWQVANPQGTVTWERP